MKNSNYARKVAPPSIQSFGYIIICDLKGTIIGLSNNFADIINDNIEVASILENNIYTFLTQHFPSASGHINTCIYNIIHSKAQRHTVIFQQEHNKYGINIFLHQEKIYLEWEEQKNSSIDYSQIEFLGHLLENKSAIWEPLCSAIHDITSFDRILLYQVDKSGLGKMIAEKTVLPKVNFLGKHFSENFMPKETIDYYKQASFKYCPNLHAPTVSLSATTNIIDLSVSQFSVLPDIHVEYVKGLNVKSLIIFPIIVNDNFWGLLIGHSFKEQRIDLQKRQLCAFLVQSAANRYEARLKKEVLSYHQYIESIESVWRKELLQYKNINCVLVQNIETLCKLPKADGVAIFYKGDIFTYGLCPTEQQMSQIKQIVDSQPKKPIFKDYNFRKNHGHKIDGNIPFAGIMALQAIEEYCIFWFRKEDINRMFHIDPKTKNGYRIWEETVLHSAIPWSENDLYFLSNLHKLIKDSIILKSHEQETFTEKLISLNNELEILSFKLSHDLKNPLAIIKLAMQMIQRDMHIEDSEKHKWIEMVQAGLLDIESIINSVLKLGKSRSYQFRKDPVPLVHILKKITQEAKELYGSKCDFELGKMLPVWGEKSLILQIFQNIVSNAVKYSSTKEHPLIKIDSYLSTDNIYYEIEDNGIGIPSEYIPQVFKVFVRANNTDNFSGTGIGLTVAKRIIERLGGQIKIDSVLNLGTKVILVFPCLGQIHPSIFTGENKPKIKLDKEV